MLIGQSHAADRAPFAGCVSWLGPGRPEFRDTAMVFWKQLRNMHNTDGLYCTMLAGDNLGCNGNHYTFGASADSAYEYMLKQWILTGGKDTVSCPYL